MKVRASLEVLADAVISSDLTLIECDRVLVRPAALGGLSEFGLVRLDCLKNMTQKGVRQLSPGKRA